jgi:hypothetical protein
MLDWIGEKMLTIIRFLSALAVALGLILALAKVPLAQAQVTKSARLDLTTGPTSSQLSAAVAGNPFIAVSLPSNVASQKSEIDFFLNVDFVDHVALVAVMDESNRPVIAGGARYVVVEPGKAELAFAVIDQYQGQGLGAAQSVIIEGALRLPTLSRAWCALFESRSGKLKIQLKLSRR